MMRYILAWFGMGLGLAATLAFADSQQIIGVSNQPIEEQASVDGIKFPAKDTVDAAKIRGENVYKRYCVLCHGVEADGKGRAAKQYDPKPANLVLSPYPTEYKEWIVRRGGEAMGRSPFMPPWEQELTNEQIADLLVFLNSIAKNNDTPEVPAAVIAQP